MKNSLKCCNFIKGVGYFEADFNNIANIIFNSDKNIQKQEFNADRINLRQSVLTNEIINNNT